MTIDKFLIVKLACITIYLLLISPQCFSQIDTSFYEDGSKRIWNFDSSKRYYRDSIPKSGEVVIEFRDYNKLDSLISEKIIYGFGHYKAVNYNEEGRKIYEQYNNNEIPVYYEKTWDQNGILYDELIDTKEYISKTTFYLNSNIKKEQTFHKYEFSKAINNITHKHPNDNSILLEGNSGELDTILKTTIIENYKSGRLKSVKNYITKRAYQFKNENELKIFLKNRNRLEFSKIVIKYKTGVWQEYNDKGKLLIEEKIDENSNIWNLLID